MSIPGLSPLPALILHQDKYSVCCLVPPLLRPSLVSALTLARLTGPSQSQIHRYTTHHNQQKYKQIKHTLWDHSKPLMRCSELFRSWNGWDNSSRCYSPWTLRGVEICLVFLLLTWINNTHPLPCNAHFQYPSWLDTSKDRAAIIQSIPFIFPYWHINTPLFGLAAGVVTFSIMKRFRWHRIMLPLLVKQITHSAPDTPVVRSSLHPLPRLGSPVSEWPESADPGEHAQTVNAIAINNLVIPVRPFRPWSYLPPFLFMMTMLSSIEFTMLMMMQLACIKRLSFHENMLHWNKL